VTARARQTVAAAPAAPTPPLATAPSPVAEAAVVPTLRTRAAATLPRRVDVIAVPVWRGRRQPPGSPVELDLAYLARLGFEGRPGEVQALPADDGTVILAVGVGPRDKVDAEALRRAAGAAARAVRARPPSRPGGQARPAVVAMTLVDAAPPGQAGPAARAVAEGVLLATYSYKEGARLAARHGAGNAERGADAPAERPVPARIAEVVVVSDDPSAAAAVAEGVAIGRAVRLARDLINEPAGTMTPARFVAVATEAARVAGLGARVLAGDGLRAARLGGLLGVAAGSDVPPRLLELLYEPPGATADTPTVAFVGKGITFDSGGLSLKTAAGMMTMKTDMSGAAAVVAAMGALAGLGAPVRVLGLCPLTENMPSGTAIRPGDVLQIRNGRTVEVLNTDAEGRLVLADALSLAVEAGVDAIVDLATLTGAVTVALGRGIAGLLGSDETWVGEVRAAAGRSGEAVWPLPLADQYRGQLDSDVADLKNVGGDGSPGTITAGLFLREFVGDLPWAHLDIAGTARSDSDDTYITRGGTGWGVRTLVELARRGTVALRPGAVRQASWDGRTPLAGLGAPPAGQP